VVTEAIEWAVDPNGDNDMSDQMDVVNLTGFNPPLWHPSQVPSRDSAFHGRSSKHAFSYSFFAFLFVVVSRILIVLLRTHWISIIMVHATQTKNRFWPAGFSISSWQVIYDGCYFQCHHLI
jgi:hypothetical protein